MFLIFAWVYLLSSWKSTVATVSPTDCLQNSTLLDLVDCLNDFTVGPDFYDASSYSTAQPSSEQIDAWTSIITSMLEVDDNGCSITIPTSLSSSYAITSFADESSGRNYCVLAETTCFPNRNYTKGWGTMVVPALKTSISRSLHFSVPHPLADIDTPQQAAALFASSGAHSLLISGRIRSAFDAPTNCVIPANPSTTYFKTDPAHDVVSMILVTKSSEVVN